MPSNLIVIYGPPLSGKTSLAWALAESLDGKSAVVSTDQLLGGSIAVPDEDLEAELEMVHVQLRLLVANYLKNRYHVVVEGAFVFERGGRLYNHEPEIEQLVALMRNMTANALIVRATACKTALTQRAEQQGRPEDAAAARRIEDLYKDRTGLRHFVAETDEATPSELAARIRERLGLSNS